MSSRLILKVFTGKNCSLCDIAKEALKKVNSKVPFEVEEIDIYKLKHLKWKYKYKNDIPVIHYNLLKDGKETEEILTMHRVNEVEVTDKLLKLLEK